LYIILGSTFPVYVDSTNMFRFSIKLEDERWLGNSIRLYSVAACSYGEGGPSKSALNSRLVDGRFIFKPFFRNGQILLDTIRLDEG